MQVGSHANSTGSLQLNHVAAHLRNSFVSKEQCV